MVLPRSHTIVATLSYRAMDSSSLDALKAHMEAKIQKNEANT